MDAGDSSALSPERSVVSSRKTSRPTMQIIRKRAYARAGLVGNPSDGYHGKTIAIIVRDLWAEVVLYEWEHVEIVQAKDDRSRFGSIGELAHDVEQHGYYGGIRLVKATIRRFLHYCQEMKLPLHERNFSIRYETNIPRQVGLAGSSAIIVATLRCLMEFYGVEIPLEVQPSLVLAVETQDLGIAAGLQDRVIQVYEGMVYMDFSHEAMHETHGDACGRYEPLDQALLPPTYIAYQADDFAQPTYVFHNDIRGRYERGVAEVVDAMQQFAQFAADAREALLVGDRERLGAILDHNFDLRRSIYQEMHPGQIAMVEAARSAGASAKFAGSGGAIIGLYRDSALFERLRSALEPMGCKVFTPIVARGVNRTAR